MKSYFIYMMTNKGCSSLYTGVTNSLISRVTQHRKGKIIGFTRRYNITRLVYYEQFNDVYDAIAREKQIKGWSRKKKEVLINALNPNWADLAVTILGLGDSPATYWHNLNGWQD